ncbi:putative glycoside hydrolase [Salinicoccus siamensis]|uniref:Glycoside hydrolase n=1 Tax=Salinicoccus siamensis TaxID=381830 RepID=A0ABV5Z294_9STAP
MKSKVMLLCLILGLMMPAAAKAEGLNLNEGPLLKMPETIPDKFSYDSGVDIPYPEDGVKGIFVTGYSAGGERMSNLVSLLNDTDLNAMVVDVKEDAGNIMMPLEGASEMAQENMQNYVDPNQLMETMESESIYPIARIVAFKDSNLAKARPDLSFTHDDGTVWKNGRGESFVNPFLKEVWDYNVDIAIQAAKLGFKDIQFDYVRFPEGFEHRADSLNYDAAEYDDGNADDVQQRVNAVTDFVEYAREKLKPYNVDVSVDIFGYAATVPEAPGIGQNFSKISNNVDVISSMIYPSHWGPGDFGFQTPDLEPYGVIDSYMEVENEVLNSLDSPPLSRPWIQDFTASYLGAGNYLNYGVEELEAQIQALHDNGVDEFLLWDATNNYTRGVDYTPE